MKDFEINKKLAELYLPCEYMVDDIQELILLANFVGDTDKLHPYGEFNYKEWNQMGSIIEELKISLKCLDTLWDAESKCGNYWSCEGNPLKAVAVVAIKILESRL